MTAYVKCLFKYALKYTPCSLYSKNKIVQTTLMSAQEGYLISLINLCCIEEVNIYGFKIVKFNIYKIKNSYYLLEKNQKHGVNWCGGRQL